MPSAAVPSKLPVPTKDQLLHWYKEMLSIRRFEEKAGQLYGMGLIGGFCHLYIGQEAVVAFTSLLMTAASTPAMVSGPMVEPLRASVAV